MAPIALIKRARIEGPKIIIAIQHDVLTAYMARRNRESVAAMM